MGTQLVLWVARAELSSVCLSDTPAGSSTAELALLLVLLLLAELLKKVGLCGAGSAPSPPGALSLRLVISESVVDTAMESRAMGMHKDRVAVEPPPSRASMERSACIRRTRLKQIARPKPRPPCVRVQLSVA
jgi:hypothetical protein